MTITYDALNLTVQGPSPNIGPQDPLAPPSTEHEALGPPSQPPASDIWWSLLETKLVHFRTPSSKNLVLKHIQSAQANGTHPTGMLSCSIL